MRKKLCGTAAVLSVFCFAVLLFGRKDSAKFFILGHAAADGGKVGHKVETVLSYEGEWLTAQGDYTYPMTPEKEEWAQLDYLEKRERCNMPQELVDILTTKELVNAALDYPLKMDYLGFDDAERGLEHLKGNSNVYRELFEREDITEALLEAYRDLQVDYDFLVSGTASNRGEKSGYNKELILQFLIGSDEIFDRLTEAQLKDLLAAVDVKCAEREGKCDDFTMPWSRNHPFLLYKMGLLADGEYIK